MSYPQAAVGSREQGSRCQISGSEEKKKKKAGRGDLRESGMFGGRGRQLDGFHQFHGHWRWILRRLKLNRALGEKGILRYECNRFIVRFRSLLSLCIFFLLIFWIFVVLLGVDCCLLRYNLEFMFVIIHLNMLCFYCDCGMLEKPLQYLHLMLFFSPNEKIH